MQNIEQARAQQEAVEKEAAEANAFLELYLEFPQLSSTANTNLLREFLNGQPITLASLKESVLFLGDRLATKDDDRLEREREQTRAALEAEYLGLLPGDADMKASVMSRAKYASDQELAEKIRLRKLEIELRKHTAQEIKAALKPSHEYQYPPLPDEYTRKILLQMPSERLRKLIRVHSEAAVNARLAS